MSDEQSLSFGDEEYPFSKRDVSFGTTGWVEKIGVEEKLQPCQAYNIDAENSGLDVCFDFQTDLRGL